MASIWNAPNGRREIQFVGGDRKRRTIRLGKSSRKAAETIKAHVEYLLAAKIGGYAIDPQTARWVADIDDTLADRLARVGLIAPRERATATALGSFSRDFLEKQAELKPSTKLSRRQVIADLTGFLGENRDVRTVTGGDADDFKQSLIARGLASSTVHKRLQNARWFFAAMLRRKLIAENPFQGVRLAASGVRDRQHFVTLDDTDAVIAACPNVHWRTIVALSRLGGLRCPSEVLSLRWRDVNWEANRLTVTAPKTEHLPGKATRIVPLFAELRPHLDAAFEAAPAGAEFVIDPIYRKAAIGPNGWANANLRTTLHKIIGRAGLKVWPRPFHNLRASRETELVERFPVHAVTEWLGNTPKIAERHYLMTTEKHFQDAAKGVGKAEAKREADSDRNLPKPVARPTSAVSRGSSNATYGDRKRLSSKVLDSRGGT